jgi:hypothetical protein
MQNKMQRCFCFQDQNWRFIKNKKKIIISSHFDLILLFFAEKLAIYAPPVLFEFKQPNMQHFLMIYSDLMNKNYEGTKKTLSIYVKTLFKVTPTLKIDLVFKNNKILVRLSWYSIIWSKIKSRFDKLKLHCWIKSY